MTRPNIHVIAAPQIPGSSYEAAAALIVGCLFSPENIAVVAAKLRPDDFDDDLLRLCFETLVYLHNEGRRPSYHSLVAELGDHASAAKALLVPLVAEAARSADLPLDDVIGLIRDRAARRQIAEAAKLLEVAATSSARPVLDAGADAIDAIDDAMARVRPMQRQSFDADACGVEVFKFLDSDEKMPTLGWEAVDKVLGGAPKGELTVIAARPGMGKTALGAGSARIAAQAGHGVAFFSVEMKARMIWMRMLTDAAYSYKDKVSYKDIITRNLSDSHRRRLEKSQLALKNLPIRIEEQSDITVAEIGSRCRKIAAEFAKRGKSLDIVYIDHMGLLKPSTRYAGSRAHEMADISNGLRVLAKDLNIALVALCQLNRGVEGREGKRPTKADLRDSGEIEEDASNVVLLFRPHYYLAQQKYDDPEEIQAHAMALEKSRHVLELIVDKNRNGEAPVTVELFVDIGANAIRRKEFGAGHPVREDSSDGT